MTSMFARRGRITLVLVLFASAVSAMVMTAVLAHPRAASRGVLGAEWDCGELLWVTSCTRIESTMPASRRPSEPHAAAVHPQPV
ncbi:hypothetical protein [Bradyrhizobium sp. HKCCYLS20291]|uniref:hypothetical protein n=1 Tax=Bradyrhizobium sp. HKCCYLS20291 TaxID=3420766 RepID=UPI003EBD35E5